MSFALMNSMFKVISEINNSIKDDHIMIIHIIMSFTQYCSWSFPEFKGSDPLYIIYYNMDSGPL